ncbi:ABC transporter ATP-binding protein [Brevibacterium ihuae]|uniref:ABC transporter ATP-binding protein n=1 Tax=Brevibacterium ihuae TaxID=1631743 RepID=UPI003CCBCF91
MSDQLTGSADTAADRTPTSTDSQGAEIFLREITKTYPGQAKPAVGGLTMEIPAGSIVMLVGPSGCGKTTTLKMINRLIEPTAGSIIMDDEDITTMDADKLRRRIGYVIQAGGLFPHMTVATNIGIVPKMLGWDKDRIAARVDELLELVSLDPDTYRDRYPRELSGGQQQRIGVARALAADPPVLLMDEPFGAVDPITRQRLQDELISIQAELKKTIVCVTHDFDEAVKLGDWIAIFAEGGQLVQYDSPEQILKHPANDFVENFIGSGAGLKQLTLSRVADAEVRETVTSPVADGPAAALAALRSSGSADDAVVILDDRERPVQWYSSRQLERLTEFPAARDEDLPVVGDRASLNDALDTMLVSSTSNAIVTGSRHRYLGVIGVETVMDAITSARGATAEQTPDSPRGENTTPAEGDS